MRNSGDETTRIAENIDSRNVEVVIGLVDYAYEQELDDIRSWWESIKIIHDNEIFLGALGNHDSDSDGDENGIEDEDVYLELFKQNSNQSSWTYSFVYGSVLYSDKY